MKIINYFNSFYASRVIAVLSTNMKISKLFMIAVAIGLCTMSCGKDEPNVKYDNPENTGGSSSGNGNNGVPKPIDHRHTLSASIDYSKSLLEKRTDEYVWHINLDLTLDNMVNGDFYTNEFTSTIWVAPSSGEIWEVCDGLYYFSVDYDNILRPISCFVNNYRCPVEVEASYNGSNSIIKHKIHFCYSTDVNVQNLTIELVDPTWTDMEYDKYGKETEYIYYGDDVKVKVDMSRINIVEDYR